MKLRKRKSFVLTVSENVIHQERSVLHHPVAVNVIDVIILVFTGRIQHESQVLLFCLGLPRRLWCYRPQMLENETFLYFFETGVAKVQSQFVKLDGNILVDKGAQRTFITAKLAKLLNLPPLRRESLILFGFTSCRGVAEHYDVVQFSIIDRHGFPIVVQAIVIPHIVDPLSDPHRAKLLSLPHLKKLKLAHPVST